MSDVAEQWSTLIIRANPLPADMLTDIHPRHRILMSTKPHKPDVILGDKLLPP